MRESALKNNERGVSPVIAVVLMVVIVVLLAAVVGILVTGIADNGPGDPQYSAVTVTGVEKSSGNIEVPEASGCQHFHVVIRMVHTEGDAFDSEDLEYVIEASGETETLSGRFNRSVATPGVTATAGDEIVIALDSDTDFEDCGSGPEDSKSVVLFEGEEAWNPDAAGQVGDLYNIHNTFLASGSPDDLEEIRIRIVHTPSETIIVDTTEDNIVDRSP